MLQTNYGKVILLNGPSSAGKSTLCQALQRQLDEPFLRFSLDFLMFNGDVLPPRRDQYGPFAWTSIREKLFAGYFQCLPALAKAGNHLLIDYIIESEDQLQSLRDCLKDIDVFMVGVRCPVEELERRELLRGDRRIGDARRDLETVHSFTAYDFEVDSTILPESNAALIMDAWQKRSSPGILHPTNR